MPKPRDLKSENIGSMPQRAEYSSVRKYRGFSDIAMIQGSACPGSSRWGSAPAARSAQGLPNSGPGPWHTARSSSCRGRRTPRGCPSGAGDAALLAPADQVGGAVEAHQPDLGLPGQPGGDRVEQRLLGLEADRAIGRLDPPGQGQCPLAAA